jgi:kynurenine formamidase
VTFPFADREADIGRLAHMDLGGAERLARRVELSRGAYDLAVELHEGIPTWREAGDPPFLQWLTLSPSGARTDMPGDSWIERGAAPVGDCFLMPSHAGTHVDCLNHIGRNGRFWGGLEASSVMGSRRATRLGAEHLPPMVMRGVLIDAAPGGTLHPTQGVGPPELDAALRREGVRLQPGDAVLLRTGWMRNWEEPFYLSQEPGLTRAGAEYLVERGAIVIGADNGGLELIPSRDPDEVVPVHSYLLCEVGVPIVENLVLDQLAADGVHEFLLVGLPLKLRGASAAPFRPIALPLEQSSENEPKSGAC